MKKILFILLVCLPLNNFAQKGITFQVENLSKPEELLRLNSYDDILKSLILSDVGMSSLRIDESSINFPFDIVAKNHIPDSLVSFGYHSFFNGMYQAYANHRPFVLSPDMIWLLISQGFARHINANSENLRHYFVDFSGKTSLIVSTNEIKLDNPNSPWENVFPEFTKQISDYTGSEIINLLSSDFTTTTTVEKVASEITVMEAMKPYFEYIMVYVVCGIPEITLKGTPDDWQKILEKTKQLGKYDLTWWTNELDPILVKFVKASKGKTDKRFWRNMFKYHSKKKYGSPKIIDGWIVKFFPYDKNNKRNNMKNLKGFNCSDNLPEEIVKVDLKFIDSETGITTPLELWAGFVGLEQNRENFALTPKTGWMIRKKDIDKTGLIQSLEANNKFGWISIRVKEFPTELLSLKEIENVEIQFLDKIIIPDEFANVIIKSLTLTGKINTIEIERIVKLFPNSRIDINGKLVNGKELTLEEILNYR